MIQRSLAAAAGLLVSGSGVFAQSTRPHGRVIVVGAGFAGLAAAFELKAAGFDVHVIEARNRIGGRVLTFFDFIRGKHVEGGGELVGANHPVWLAYRDRFKLTFRDVTEEELDVPVVLQGQRLSAADAEALWKELEAATGLMNDPARAIGDPYRPWTAANAAALDGQSLADWIASRPDLTDRCKHALALSFVADNGVEADRQSLLGLLAMIKGAGVERFWTETEVFRCDGGNQLLARRLATAIGLDRITLKMPVRRIVSSERGVRVHGSDGSAREADFAVLAVPPSTWRRLAVEPPLPSTLTPQMGENVKYLMALGTRAWRRDQLAADSFTDGPIHLTWEQTQGQPGAAASLIAFSGAAAARQCRSWPAAERAARYRDALGTLYPTVARSILRTRFMDWPGDPWTAASYSFPAPGELTTSGALLQEAHGRMYFAGEHTCPAFPGYMEGALQSGARVAKQIAARAQVLTPTSSVAGPSPSGATRS